MELRHSRPYRLLLLLLVAALALLALLPPLLDAEPLRNFVQAAVFDSSGRTLSIKGATRIHLLPHPGVSVEQLTLSEQDGTTPFARADRLNAEISLWALMTQGRLEVNTLEIDDARMVIRKRADGSYNFDDLLADSASPQNVSFRLNQFEMKNARLDFVEPGRSVSLYGLDVALADITNPTRGSFEAHGMLGSWRNGAEQWSVMLDARSALRYEASRRRIHIAALNIDAEQRGDTAQQIAVSKGTLHAEGQLVLGWQPLRLASGAFSMAASATRADQAWQFTLDAPAFRFERGLAVIDQLALKAEARAAEQRLVTEFKLPKLLGTDRGSLRADEAAIAVQHTSPTHKIRLDFISPLELYRGTRLKLDGFALTGRFGHQSLPRGEIPLQLNGNAELDLASEKLAVTQQGLLDNQPLSSAFELNDFVSPRYRFSADLARLDLTPYLPVVSDSAKQITPAARFDLDWLRTLNAQGMLSLGELVLNNLRLEHLAFGLNARDGVAYLSPLSARVYEGTLTGDIRIDRRAFPAKWQFNTTLNDVAISPLLADLVGTSRVEGRGALALSLTASGATLKELRHSADGDARLSVSDGALRGIDFAAALREAGNRSASTTINADTEQRTRFSTLSASIKLEDGITRNDDLTFHSPLFDVRGAGQLDLADGLVDYTLTLKPNAREFKALAGITLPVTINGPFSAPQYQFDYSALRERLTPQPPSRKTK
ncbi:AsmA family protein [Chitinibacteraceae bacterium HSL-7]